MQISPLIKRVRTHHLPVHLRLGCRATVPLIHVALMVFQDGLAAKVAEGLGGSDGDGEGEGPSTATEGDGESPVAAPVAAAAAKVRRSRSNCWPCLVHGMLCACANTRRRCAVCAKVLTLPCMPTCRHLCLFEISQRAWQH